MSRSDSGLYTGLTSSSFAKEHKKREERKKKNESKKEELRPLADDLLAIVTKEKESISAELLNIFKTDMSEKDLKAVLVGLKDSSKRIERIERSIKLKLGVKA